MADSMLSPAPSSPSSKSPSLSASSMSLHTPPLTPDCSPSDFEIVVAHFNEDLEWLSEYSGHCTIYSKGTPPPPSIASSFHRAFVLPNIARESHTYLTHIVNNYDDLPPVTLLLQGNIHEINHGTPAHTDLTISEIIGQASEFTNGRTMPIGRVHSFADWQGIQYLPGWIERRGKTLKQTKLTPAEFWELIFNEPHPESVRFVQGALFGVTRGGIRRRPKAFYENILSYFEELDEINPEEGHFMERFWYGILSDDAVVDAGEDGNGAVADKVNGSIKPIPQTQRPVLANS